jgi:hypothetical protein
MTRTPGVSVPGINLSFRPSGYFWPLGAQTHLLATIKGAVRKAAARRLIADGRMHELPDFLLRSALTDDERLALGRLHPDFMGGEYLPNLHRQEVEIARIVIASTTQDVTSVYARRGKRRIYYRVVDEYGGDTLCGPARRTSTKPLTLGQLEEFFNATWSIYDVLDMNFGERGYDLDVMDRFVVSVESQFYPDLGRLYRQRIREWGRRMQVQAAVDALGPRYAGLTPVQQAMAGELKDRFPDATDDAILGMLAAM